MDSSVLQVGVVSTDTILLDLDPHYRVAFKRNLWHSHGHHKPNETACQGLKEPTQELYKTSS